MPKAFIPREHISPSDLTFLFAECPRCFWLKYNLGVSRPGFMPLVGPMAAMQEKTFQGKTSSDLGLKTQGGLVTSWGQTVISDRIKVKGKPTKWFIKGKYDLVLSFANSKAAIIDCKVTTGAMDDKKVELYRPQLEAYAFALENPQNGEPVDVVETGLLMWRVSGANTNSEKLDPVFEIEPSYLHSNRDPHFFQMFITRVIELLEGDLPSEGEDCTFCKYLNKRTTAMGGLTPKEGVRV
jgi:hypothetical protein